MSSNFASPTMLQSVTCLSFSVFGGSLKIEFGKLQSMFNLCFSGQNTTIVHRTTQEGGGGVHSYGNFFVPSALSPDPLPSMRWEIFFGLPPPPPLLRYTSLERGKRKIRVYRVVTSPNMNDFSAEYIKDLVITQRKTQSEVSLFLKERFPSKKDLSSKSVRRFCFENGINLHNRLSNDELEQSTRDVVARLSLSLLDLSVCCSLFSSFFYLHLLVFIAVYMSAL